MAERITSQGVDTAINLVISPPFQDYKTCSKSTGLSIHFLRQYVRSGGKHVESGNKHYIDVLALLRHCGMEV